MEIVDITFDDKKNLFVIHFSKDSLNASYNLYNELNLTKGKKLTSLELEKLQEFNSFNLNYSKALNFISYRIRTKKEIYDKLIKDNVAENTIEIILQKLESLGYINDEKFAKSYFESKTRINNWSNRRIEYELKAKGIDQDIINNFSNEFKDLEFENAMSISQKKLPQWEKKYQGFKLKNKIYTFLSSKGFDYNTIEKVLGELI